MPNEREPEAAIVGVQAIAGAIVPVELPHAAEVGKRHRANRQWLGEHLRMREVRAELDCPDQLPAADVSVRRRWDSGARRRTVRAGLAKLSD